MNGSDSISPGDHNSPAAQQKRKSEDGQPQQRAKRARYISLAWLVEITFRWFRIPSAD